MYPIVANFCLVVLRLLLSLSRPYSFRACLTRLLLFAMALVPAMKVYSFLEILANRVRVAPNHFLYVISTEDTVLYIGQSFDVTNRLRGHVYGQMERYSFQHLFYSNLPDCFSWVIHVFTLED